MVKMHCCFKLYHLSVSIPFHSSHFYFLLPPFEIPLQILHIDHWGINKANFDDLQLQ